jgi:hypothetical protein
VDKIHPNISNKNHDHRDKRHDLLETKWRPTPNNRPRTNWPEIQVHSTNRYQWYTLKPKRTMTFEKYLQSLDLWEAILLTTLKQTTTYMTLKTAIDLGEWIYLVTYGGQTEDDGYFGWAISTETTILWRGGGYV